MFVQKLQARYVLVEAGRRERYMAMFNKTSPEFRKGTVPGLIDWALENLQREDRIVWFLKQARMSDQTYKYKYVRDDQTVTPVHRLKSQLSHWLGQALMNNYQSVVNFEWPANATFKEIIDKLEQLTDQEELKKEEQDRLIEDPDPAWIKFQDGWQWQYLDRKACEREAKSMQHCGNAPSRKPGDKILSLREPVERDGKTLWLPHLTFIFNDGQLGEMKGFKNQKPAPKFHPYIVKLLEDERIKKVKGGGYKPQNNFKLKDLTEQQHQALEKVRPELIQQSLPATKLEELKEQFKNHIEQLNEYYTENDDNIYAESLFYSDTSITLDHLDRETKELVDYFLEFNPGKDGEKRLKEMSKVEYSDHFYNTNEICSMTIGEVEDQLPDEISEQLEELSDEDLEELKRDLDAYISDSNDFIYLDFGYDRWVLILDEKQIGEAVQDIKNELGEDDDEDDEDDDDDEDY